MIERQNESLKQTVARRDNSLTGSSILIQIQGWCASELQWQNDDDQQTDGDRVNMDTGRSHFKAWIYLDVVRSEIK